MGRDERRVLVRHVLPNCLAPIIVTTTLGIANVSFIQDNLWLSLFPGLAIFVTVLGFNLFGDGLRDALDPRLK